MARVEGPLSLRRAGRFYLRMRRMLGRLGFGKDSSLILLAVVIGALTGLGSVGFMRLIELFHEWCYGPQGLYQGRGVLLVLLPAGGAILVGLITYFFAREARGHGVPEVMDAIARKGSHIRPRVALAKAVASALTIGSGGSAGTEGPIIQIGAALGSTLGRFFQIARHNLPVMVGCGAAAGISAIFHAPIAGVLFAIEIFLRELNFKTFSPVLIASVISSVVVSAMLGENRALFGLLETNVYSFQWMELGNYVVLGVLCAAAAVFFVKMLYLTEDFFDWLKIHPVLKPVLGAVALGVLGLILVMAFGQGGSAEPMIFGNGYPLIGHCIGARMSENSTVNLTVGLLTALVLMKTLATCCTLGSGGSGGVFAPSLFLGAAVGYALGLALQQWDYLPGVTIHPQTYALVGMASVVAATTHAPMAAIVILFEMTRNYQVILPVMFAATIALAIAQLLFRDSIYTLKLRRRGVHFESRADTALLRRLTVEMVMQRQRWVIYDDLPLHKVIEEAVGKEYSDIIVIDHHEKYVGLLVANDLRSALLQPESIPFLVAGELARQNIPTVGPDQTLDETLDQFSRLDVNSLAVHQRDRSDRFVGMITRADLMRRYQQELKNK